MGKVGRVFDRLSPAGPDNHGIMTVNGHDISGEAAMGADDLIADGEAPLLAQPLMVDAED